MPIKYLSVFSGMEAATVAWHHMGWQPVGFSEIEPFPSAILKHHYPTIPNYGDITKYKSWNLKRGSIDILAGGSPCQAFSVAGLRKGLADPRGNLALTFLGLADHLRPKYILWENVPGVLSSNGGKDFGSFIGALAELGYGFAWRVCDAQYFGVPQRRKRVFLLAIEGVGNWRTAAEILFERKSLSGDIASSDEAGEGIASNAGASVETGGNSMSPDGLNTIGALLARDYKGFGNQDIQSGRGLVLPFRKSKRASSETDNETWVDGDVSNTFNNFDLGDTRTTHAVVYENHPNDSRVTGPHDVAPTVVSRFGTGGGNVPLVNQEAYSIREDAKANNFSATPLEVTPALQSLRPSVQSHHAQTFIAQGVDLYNQALTGDLHCPLRTAGGHGAPALLQTMAVRRLTPVECERLQGFPDNYSQIPWKNKPAEQCPDGPRYKACGNSMAVPVMRWIGERIQKYIDKQNI